MSHLGVQCYFNYPAEKPPHIVQLSRLFSLYSLATFWSVFIRFVLLVTFSVLYNLEFKTIIIVLCMFEAFEYLGTYVCFPILTDIPLTEVNILKHICYYWCFRIYVWYSKNISVMFRKKCHIWLECVDVGDSINCKSDKTYIDLRSTA